MRQCDRRPRDEGRCILMTIPSCCWRRTSRHPGDRVVSGSPSTKTLNQGRRLGWAGMGDRFEEDGELRQIIRSQLSTPRKVNEADPMRSPKDVGARQVFVRIDDARQSCSLPPGTDHASRHGAARIRPSRGCRPPGRFRSVCRSPSGRVRAPRWSRRVMSARSAERPFRSAWQSTNQRLLLEASLLDRASLQLVCP